MARGDCIIYNVTGNAEILATNNTT